jgi:cytochrome c oxidase assembly protein subunit 15
MGWMVTNCGPRTSDSPRWLHYWAVLTVCAALPLLLLGAEVTTMQAGMVDQEGFRAPWHLWTVALREKGLGFVIEHSHRLAGFVVGSCAIVLAVGMLMCERRRWARWLGVAALVGVSMQGVLGILRVNLNAVAGPELALVHGCFAPLVIALLVSVALFTSRGWAALGDVPVAPHDAGRLRRCAFLTVGLVYLQIVLGALVRHKGYPLGARAHLLIAFAVVAAVAWLTKMVLDNRSREPALNRSVRLLLLLVGLQVFLGIEAWLSKFVSVEATGRQLQPLQVHPGLLQSIHSLVGSLILATAVVVALQTQCIWFIVRARARNLAPDHSPLTTHHSPTGRLEGAA